MMAFEISVNGRHVATIGIGEEGVLSTHVTWVAGKYGPDAPRLHAGGLAAPTQEYLSWPMPRISRGDEVTIKVVESDEITPEAERRPAKEMEHRP